MEIPSRESESKKPMTTPEHRIGKCSAKNKSGAWKGHPCCNDSKFDLEGQGYCTVHYGLAVSSVVSLPVTPTKEN